MCLSTTPLRRIGNEVRIRTFFTSALERREQPASRSGHFTLKKGYLCENSSQMTLDEPQGRSAVLAEKITHAGKRISLVHPEIRRPVTAVSKWGFVKVDFFIRCQRRAPLSMFIILRRSK